MTQQTFAGLLIAIACVTCAGVAPGTERESSSKDQATHENQAGAEKSEKRESPSRNQNAEETWYAHIKSANALIGSRVEGADGEEYGLIRDLILDLDTGTVAIVLLGAGEATPTLMALPTSALWLEGDRLTITPDITQTQIDFVGRLTQAHGEKPYTRVLARELYGAFKLDFPGKDVQARPLDGEEPLYLWTELSETKIVDSSGNYVGEIEDLAIAPSHQRIVYAAINTSAAGRDQRMLLPIPLGAFVSQGYGEPFLLELPESRLSEQHRFSRQSWPRKVPEGWIEYVHVRYGKNALDGVQPTPKQKTQD